MSGQKELVLRIGSSLQYLADGLYVAFGGVVAHPAENDPVVAFTLQIKRGDNGFLPITVYVLTKKVEPSQSGHFPRMITAVLGVDDAGGSRGILSIEGTQGNWLRLRLSIIDLGHLVCWKVS